MRPVLFAVLLSALAPVAARAADPHSYAQPDEVRVRHLALDLRLDFPHRVLAGHAHADAGLDRPQGRRAGAGHARPRHRTFEAIDGEGHTSRSLHPGATRRRLGSKLTIAAPSHPAQVRITYATSPAASGCNGSSSRADHRQTPALHVLAEPNPSMRARGCRCRTHRRSASPTMRTSVHC